MTYADYLAAKRVHTHDAGFAVDELDAEQHLFHWQASIVKWALDRGRSCVFADTGLGKTRMQTAWAHEVAKHTGGRVLLVAPLAVAAQTVREAAAIGITIKHAHEAEDAADAHLVITNYERLDRFTGLGWSGVVLDESSILKSYDGKFKQRLVEWAATVPYRLAATATPAPNDVDELLNHAEFVGTITRSEALALYFTQDGNTTTSWRLKRHATGPFWDFVASWAVALRKPTDFDANESDDGYDLDPLEVHHHVVDVDEYAGETLFAVAAQTMIERRRARTNTIDERVRQVAAIVAEQPDEQWVVWCDLNAESEALARAIPGAVEVAGSHTEEHKTRAMLGFADGAVRVLVTKPSIAGFGMNLQRCARVAFVGLSYSYEQFYQAVRRCHRYGQTRPVHVHIVTTPLDGAVVTNIARKQREASRMTDELIRRVNTARHAHRRAPYEQDDATGDGWRLLLGDCVERIAELDDDTIDLSVFSPPFPGMYVYTDSERDMGNVASIDELIAHYEYLAPELLRVTKPGRTCAVHLAQGVTHKWKDGVSGRTDFRGRVIDAMTSAGWTFYGEVTIDKNPQVKAIRTKDRGLLFKSLATDSSVMRMAQADYLIQFVKPGDNADPIRAGRSDKYGNPNGWITEEEWIEWAAPVWYSAHRGMPGGIRETDVLNVAQARDEKDERHLCPLQLGVIERCVKLWSNPGDVVLSPFAGIGSEGVGALRYGRRYVGIELKRSYFESAKKNLAAAVQQQSLFADEPSIA